MRAAQAQSTEDCEVKMKLVAPPLYVLTTYTLDKAKVRDALEATRGYVGTGGVVNMSAQDHMGLDLSAFRMLEVSKGDWQLVK